MVRSCDMLFHLGELENVSHGTWHMSNDKKNPIYYKLWTHLDHVHGGNISASSGQEKRSNKKPTLWAISVFCSIFKSLIWLGTTSLGPMIIYFCNISALIGQMSTGKNLSKNKRFSIFNFFSRLSSKIFDSSILFLP